MARHVLQESPPFKAQRSACERAMDYVGCASSVLRCDLLFERRCDRLVELGEEVTVTVERHVDRAVAHTRLDCLRVCSCRDRERDARMPEVVKAAGEGCPVLGGLGMEVGRAHGWNS